MAAKKSGIYGRGRKELAKPDKEILKNKKRKEKMRKIKKLLRWYDVMSRRAAQKQMKLYATRPDLLKMQILTNVALDSVTSSIK